MSESTEHTQVLGEVGETCHECGAALAVDQRYCLNCGRRRGGPRVDFQQHPQATGIGPGGMTEEAVASVQPGATATPTTNGAAPAPPGHAVGTSPATARPQRDFAPLAAVGGIAVLGLMLLVGVLIGKGGDSATPPPQVVQLGGEGGATAADAGGEAVDPKARQGKSKGEKTAAGKAASAGSLTGSKGGAGPVEASDEALQELQEQSPEEYQESSAKLPDEIATGGPPPPKDSKTPGGGSKGVAIE